MSKSNTDFSAFDFNDSSDNSDIASRTPLFNRSTLSNNNSDCSLKINVNINNMNNSNHEHHNINSNSQHSDQSNASRKSRASSSSSTTSSASSSSNSSSSNDNNLSNKKRNESKIPTTNVNEHLIQKQPINNRQRTINSNNNNNNDNTNRNDNNNHQRHEDDDDDDEDDDDDDDDEDYDDDEDNLSNNNNTSRNRQHNNNSSRAKTNNSNSHSHGNSNNIRTDGLLIGTALRRDNNGCSNLDAKISAGASGADVTGNNNNNNNNNLIANSMQAAAAAVAAVAAAAASNAVNNNMNESSGHTGNPTGMGMASGNLSCGEFARCSSASLSNSCSTNLGGVTGGVGVAYNSSERKKYRHQNYSKNIYIGTKNAEKWELTRSRLRFKNDVEFVAYLLNLADNDPERLAK